MKKQALGIFAALFALMLLAWAYAADTSAVEYAILYADGTLVFQNSETPESGKSVTKTYPVDLSAIYFWDDDEKITTAPWFQEAESVRVVNFADKISPRATAYWFFNCANLERVDNIQNLDTANAVDMSYMFYECGALTALDVSGFKTANATNMAYMFYNCYKLTALDVSGFDTANVKNMSSMFAYCNALTALDVSGFKTAKVTSMYRMFNDCSGLTALDVSGFDTANVTHMASMFGYCSKLTALDVSGFKTAEVVDMDDMFTQCEGLTALDLSGFDTAKVADMRAMFADCHRLTALDVSGFKTEWVTNMSDMFSGCNGLTTLDLSNFDTGRVSNMTWMFESCLNLKTIYASGKFKTELVADNSGMFEDCESLVGGNGTAYDGSHVGTEYARIDTPDAPGYFTAKTATPLPITYKIIDAETFNGMLSVTLTNPSAATLAVSYFDANGKFVSVALQDVQANAGTAESSIPANATTARVMLLDDGFRPLCAARPATL